MKDLILMIALGVSAFILVLFVYWCGGGDFERGASLGVSVFLGLFFTIFAIAARADHLNGGESQ